MTQLNEEHFEVIEKNKIERYERQKLTFLEERMKVMEKSIGALNTSVGKLNETVALLSDMIERGK
jgi:hypothetical protein